MKVREYILAIVMAGLAFGSMHADNTTAAVPSLAVSYTHLDVYKRQ